MARPGQQAGGPPKDVTSPFGSFDWSATALGPQSLWPEELLAAVRTFLPSRLPIMICWGEDLVQIYNDAFAPLLGDRHPAAMGQRARDCWAKEWPTIEPRMEGFFAGDRPYFDEEVPIFLNRHGTMEETYWDLSLNVIPDSDGERQGLMFSAMDNTARVVSNRRLSTIHELSVMSTAGMLSLAEVCQSALKVMSRNRPALPFAACYLREGDDLQLVASYGAASGGSAFRGRIAMQASYRIARAARTGLQEVVDDLAEIADPQHIEPSPLGNASPTSAMLIPLLPSAEVEPLGVLVLGSNPYRPVDLVYQSFFDLVSRQLGTLLMDAQAYQEQRHRAEMLAVLQDSQTRFFQNVSHEFRTPLTLVLGALEELTASPGPGAEQLEAARRAALRLDRLVDSLLTFAQAESGTLVVRREATDLGRLTDEAASMFRSAIERAGLEYLVELPDEPLIADIDQEMWSRIVVNLLSNAYKFTARGHIRVRLATSGEGLTLTVEDTGVGIAAAAQERVFQRFQQASEGQVRSGPGAGIGLSLVADLIRAQHGNVEVSSEPGVGSTFTVSLPLKTRSSPPTPAASVDERIQAQTISDIVGTWDEPTWTGAGETVSVISVGAGSASDDGPTLDPSSRRLLLVEDNGDLRRYLGRLLRGSGWTVVAVADAESALRQEEVPDIILTDVMLPGRDGLSLVRMIRANPDLSMVPVILLTARAGAEAVAEGLRAGADDYIVKPFNAQELLARLDVHHELSCLRNHVLAQAQNQVLNLETALSSNRRIGAAVGVLMGSMKVTSSEAFELLRKASNESNRKLRDVADRVVLTGALDPTVTVSS